MPFETQQIKVELTHLLHRLARLLQEIGDRGLEPEVIAPTAYLRPHYLRLAWQAARLAEAMGFDEGESTEHVCTLLLEQLRNTTHTERRQRMSLQEALGEVL